MPKIDTTVEMNAQEQALCLTLGKKPCCNNRAAGVKNAKRDSQSDAETDLEGVAAQNQGRAVCAMTEKVLYKMRCPILQYHGEFSRGEWNIERHQAKEDE
jgi:hypothetical protein